MLNKDDANALEARIRTLEARTGTQVVVALVARSEVSDGLRWRAFAVGATMSALALTLSTLLRSGWSAFDSALVAAMVILGGGLACTALATIWLPFERLFMPRLHAHAQVRRHAAALFFERELFATPRRNGVLLLVSRFERAMAVIGDSGFRGHIDEAAWQQVVDATTAELAADRWRAGFDAGLDALEALLTARGFVAAAPLSNDLPDAPLVIESSR